MFTLDKLTPLVKKVNELAVVAIVVALLAVVIRVKRLVPVDKCVLDLKAVKCHLPSFAKTWI